MHSLSKIHLISRMYSVILHSLQRISRKLLNTSKKDQSMIISLKQITLLFVKWDLQMSMTFPGVFLLHKLILHVIPLVQVHIACNGLHKVRAVLHIKAVCLRVMYCLMPQNTASKSWNDWKSKSWIEN